MKTEDTEALRRLLCIAGVGFLHVRWPTDSIKVRRFVVYQNLAPYSSQK